MPNRGHSNKDEHEFIWKCMTLKFTVKIYISKSLIKKPRGLILHEFVNGFITYTNPNWSANHWATIPAQIATSELPKIPRLKILPSNSWSKPCWKYIIIPIYHFNPDLHVAQCDWLAMKKKNTFVLILHLYTSARVVLILGISIFLVLVVVVGEGLHVAREQFFNINRWCQHLRDQMTGYKSQRGNFIFVYFTDGFYGGHIEFNTDTLYATITLWQTAGVYTPIKYTHTQERKKLFHESFKALKDQIWGCHLDHNLLHTNRFWRSTVHYMKGISQRRLNK